MGPIFRQKNMTQTQHLETLYCRHGATFFGQVDSFIKERKLYGSSVILYIIREEHAVDIDTEEDLRRAKFLFSRLESSDE